MLPVIIIIVINILGFLLRYNELDRFIVFSGFRFHLSLLLPAILFFRKEMTETIKEMLFRPLGRRYILTSFFILIPPLILTLVLYFTGKAELNDPDYLYELGFSSIIDFPLYLVWNMPQLLVTGLFLLISCRSTRFKFPVIFISMLLLFAYEFIPLGKEALAVNSLLSYAAVVLMLSLFLSGVRNVYLFALAAFAFLWTDILLFGSSSQVLIKLLLARTYESWEGFFGAVKAIRPYIILLHCGVTFILFAAPLIILSFRKEEKMVKGNRVKTRGSEHPVEDRQAN